MAAAVGTEVEDTIRDLKKIPGFTSYLILNNDGIVIKYDNMTYKTAVHHAHVVLSLTGKASKYVRDLFDAPDNEVESIRLHTSEYEMIIAQHGNYTVVSTQQEVKKVEADKAAAAAAAAGAAGEEGKKDEEKKEAV